MKFSELASVLEKLEGISGRNKITELLSELFSNASVGEIDKITYLLLGTLAPNFRGIVFNVAEKMMLQVLASAYEIELGDAREIFKKVGDVGLASFELSNKYSQKIGSKKPLNVNDVYKILVTIAKDGGEGSQERKVQGLANLINKLDPLSAKYVARIPIGKLRLGFSDKTIIDALSFMVVGDKSAKKQIEQAYQYLPDIGIIAKRIKEHGLEKATSEINLEIGIPVMPMLAQRLNSTEEMVKKMGKVAVEPKFDGVRILIHYAKEKNGEKPFVRAFTRNLNDVSGMFPELKKIGKYIKADSVILDSEGVGIDPKTEKMVDFQKTMKRRRKKEIGKASKDVPFRFQIFDVMSIDEKSYMEIPYTKRREALSNVIKKNKLITIDDYIVTDNARVIKGEHQRLLDLGLEGVIVKKLNAKYIPGRTGWRWVKMKEVEGTTGKLSDTVDCVVMGYTRGKGKRASFGIGQFLAGILDNDAIKSVTKVGTGLTDDQLKALSKRLSKIVSRNKPREYMEVHRDLQPDYWVKPEVVVELAADEITISSKHAAGYALRFPRLVKFRDDKSVKQLTTIKEIKKLYKLQKV